MRVGPDVRNADQTAVSHEISICTARGDWVHRCIKRSSAQMLLTSSVWNWMSASVFDAAAGSSSANKNGVPPRRDQNDSGKAKAAWPVSGQTRMAAAVRLASKLLLTSRAWR